MSGSPKVEGAVAVGAAHGLHQQVGAVGARARQVEAREHVEHLGQEYAAGGWRRGAHHAPAAVVGDDGRTLHDPVGGQVFEGPDTPGRAHPGDQELGGTAGIETFPTRGGEALQGSRQVRLQDPRPRRRCGAIPEELFGSGGGLPQHRKPLFGEPPVMLVYDKTGVRETDRRREGLHQG